MAHTVKKGMDAEDRAVEFLHHCGYQILEKNWRTGHLELDIIAKDGDVLVFVEVKSRATKKFGDPALSVSREKQKRLISAASRYMESIGHDWMIRFDIITLIVRSKDDFELEHFKDAFFPGL